MSGKEKMSNPGVAVLVTMDSKGAEARFLADVLAEAGVYPLLVDLSCKPHETGGADIGGEEIAAAAGRRWEELAGMERNAASEIMMEGGRRVVAEKFQEGEIRGAVGLGGANGTSMACAIMRALPPLAPKVMVSVVAATAAVQWYVAESDIMMFPAIGDFTLNRITRGVLTNAALALAGMVKREGAPKDGGSASPPLIGVSSFGGTAACVERVERRLTEAGYEVIFFHASGPGGRALESLAGLGELAGVVDVTTHELTDLLVDGVYSAGAGRLEAAGAAGVPQVVVPGALDHANFWTGQVPGKYQKRAFFQYNAQNLLMRTNREEFEALGVLMAEKLNRAKGPLSVLVPTRGYSEHTKRKAHDLEGRDAGDWRQPEVDAAFEASLREHLKTGEIVALDMHINDPAFADACAEKMIQLLARG